MEAVNFYGITINLDEITAFLKQKMTLREICCQIVYERIVEREATARNIVVTAEEINQEAEEVRRAKRLEKASDTIAWLEDEIATVEEWEEGIRKQLQAKKLARELFASEAEVYFNQNRVRFEKFILYQLVVPYEKLAQELFYQIEEEEISFYEAVHLYDIDSQRRYVCGYEGEVYRQDYPADLAAAIFKMPISVGELTGPIRSPQGYHLFRIENYIPAQLTPELHREIIDRLFQQWLVSEFNYMIHNHQNS